MISITTLYGCAEDPSKGQFIGAPAPSSKFSKLKFGMGIYDVKKLIGQPDDQYEHVDASGYNRQMEFYYKNEGQLTFDYSSSMANHLAIIRADQNATGSRQ
jgi:hypothetical protein